MRPLCILLFALLAPLAAGQLSVDPVERHIVVTAGKSTKITIDAGDCSPTWTAMSSNTNVAEVSPTSAGAGSKRTFSVKTNAQGEATITISVVGAGPKCGTDYDVAVTIISVMDVKAVSKFFKKGLKGPLKTLKGQSKQVPKDYQDTLKAILQALKDETLGNEGPGGPSLSHGEMASLAVSQGEDALTDAFDEIFDEYVDAVMGMKSGGDSAAALYGFGLYLDSLPPGFFAGGCGEWDDATRDGWKLFVDTVNKLNALAKKFDENVVKESAGMTGFAFIGTALEVPEFTTGNVSIGSDFKGDFGPGTKTFKQKRPKASNYVDEDGSNQHGRIRAKGKADPAGGNLTVTYERLDSNGDPVGENEGDYFQDTGVTISSKCTWRSNAPSLGTTPNLRPGKWRVTVTQGTGENAVDKVREVTVPVPKS